jgi:hypothetical protein
MCYKNFSLLLILFFSMVVVPAAARYNKDEIPIQLEYLRRGSNESYQEKWTISKTFTSLHKFESSSNDGNAKSRRDVRHNKYHSVVSGSDHPRRRRKLKNSHSEIRPEV